MISFILNPTVGPSVLVIKKELKYLIYGYSLKKKKNQKVREEDKWVRSF